MAEIKSVESIVAGQISNLYERSRKIHQELEWNQQVASLCNLWQEIRLELADIREIIIEHPQEYTEDLEWRSIVDIEVARLSSKTSNLQQKLNILLSDLHSDKYKNIFLEIRAIAGDEASQWVKDLMQMYVCYVEDNKYKAWLVSEYTEKASGLDSIILVISGVFARCLLQFESGIHLREQTSIIGSNSTISYKTEAKAIVTVIPMMDEDNIKIDVEDIEMKTFRPTRPLKMSGVNKVEIGVDWLHKPTGIHVVCDRERSQRQNREWAREILKSKLYALNIQKQLGESSQSCIIRTYDYPSNCVTDLNSGMNYPLDRVLKGDLDSLITSHAPNHPII